MTQSCIGYRRSAFSSKSHKPSEVKTPGRTAARYVPFKSEGQKVLVSLLAHRTYFFDSQIDGTFIKKEFIPLLYRTGSQAIQTFGLLRILSKEGSFSSQDKGRFDNKVTYSLKSKKRAKGIGFNQISISTSLTNFYNLSQVLKTHFLAST